MKYKANNIQDLENRLWGACDQLRGNLTPEEYMHVVIGILFLNQISSKYEYAVNKIKENYPNGWERKINDLDYLSKFGCNFIVPRESSWEYISGFTTDYKIGQILDDAFRKLESENESLQGLFVKNYAREDLDKKRLGGVISIFANISIDTNEDIMGRVYEYFLGKFFLDKGQKSGQFYTPKSIVSLIVNFINPTKGILYDPCCGTGGMFVQAKQHLEENNKTANDLIIYGQEYESTTWKLGKINLLLNGFDNSNIHLGSKSADTFSNDLHKSINGKADYILANPPFNLKVYSRENRSWTYGMPPEKNANYAWLQIIMEKLNTNGKAGVVLANGSLTSTTNGEDKIRKAIVEDNKISAIVLLPDKLFFTTGISASIWFFDNNKKSTKTLMIDASNKGKLIEGSKKHKELTSDDLIELKNIYDKFLDNKEIDIPGLAKSVTLEEIKENNYLLSPGRYVSLLEEEKQDKETIKKELKEEIEKLISLMNEEKDLEEKVLKAIKKLNDE